MIKPHCLNFRVITAMVDFLGILHFWCTDKSVPIWSTSVNLELNLLAKCKVPRLHISSRETRVWMGFTD